MTETTVECYSVSELLIFRSPKQEISEMIPFDLELAKAGKPYTAFGTQLTLTFVAVSKCGYIISQTDKGEVYSYNSNFLEMLPENTVKYVNLYSSCLCASGYETGQVYDSYEDAQDARKSAVGTYIKTIEIEI